jgi:hypothetical protein
MSQSWIHYAVAGVILIPMIGVSRAQPAPPRDDWLMQNYRFTGPPAASELRPVDPVLTELREIQNTVRKVLRRASFEGDNEAALAAAAQAVANAHLIGAISRQQQTGQAAKSAKAEEQSSAPFFLIALKDETINAATSYWVDGPMLNYLTLQGVHMVVRLDLVDRGLSRELNRERNVEFRLPE